MTGATDTDDQLRRLIVEEGLTAAEASERLDLPEAVIEKWTERQGDLCEASAEPESEASSEGAEQEDSSESADSLFSDRTLYRCSHCRDTIAKENVEAHEDRCLRGTDWSKLSE